MYTNTLFSLFNNLNSYNFFGTWVQDKEGYLCRVPLLGVNPELVDITQEGLELKIDIFDEKKEKVLKTIFLDLPESGEPIVSLKHGLLTVSLKKHRENKKVKLLLE
jgi:hypothetical protein